MSEPTDRTDFDLIAIGGGSGGLAVAQRAAQYGARAAVIEGGRLGGTCVNLGCVPKKLLWHAASLLGGIGDAAGYGIPAEQPDVDWPRLTERREAFLRRLNGVYARNLEQRAVHHITGWARLEAPTRVRVGDRLYSARHVVLAPGSRALRPDLPGAALGGTSDDFFALTTLPRRAAVVGSGYIAVELASLLRGFGVEVQLVVRHGGVLRQFDALVQDAVGTTLQDDGVQLVTGFAPTELRQATDGLRLRADDGRESEPVDALFWAIGRGPATSGLGLEALGMPLDARGFVVTDEWQDTALPGLHAIGDVTGRQMLTPVAIAAGRRLADRLFDGQAERRLDYRNIPTVVFTHPPVGTVGLTEAEARATLEQVEVRTTRFVPLYYALAPKRRHAQMKLVLAGPQQRVVGVHLVGDGAEEMLQGFAVALRMGATLRDLQDTVAIHPTNAEELVTIR